MATVPMSSRYEVEFSEPTTSLCECCGGLTVRLTRFVYRSGDAFAIYYAAYSNNDAHEEIAMLVSLGEWGEGSVASERAAFYCRVRPTAESYEVMLGDAAESAWGTADIVGDKLAREQARQHPWKATAFEVLDEAFLQDRSLRGFLHRAQCGDAGVPLEKSFQAPDVIFSLGSDEQSRADVRRNFAVLDSKRFFVRCLLPVPVEGYEAWCIGLWVEVSKVDYDELVAAWDDPVQYPTLQFAGRVANDVQGDLALPVSMGDEVLLHVPDADAPPTVKGSPVGDLTMLLQRTWARVDFEQWAVARGFL